MRQSPPMDIDDPRIFPAEADAAQAPLLDLAAASLAASSTIRAEEIDRALAAALAQRLYDRDGSFVAELVAAAPSPAIARQLWRRLEDAWRMASRRGDDALGATLFALPLVLVAAGTEGDAEIAGGLHDVARIAAILRAHRALGGGETFALAAPLVAADALDLARLPQLLSWQRDAADGASDPLPLQPTPVAVKAGQEGVHLRFLAGIALAAGDVDLLDTADATGWAMPLAQELARQLAGAGHAVLALPRRAQTPLAALREGRIAQREIGAQLFASNAIRKLRARAGEPSAVISAHRSAAAPGGGELRLSLSSPFDAAQPEGFRCPLFAGDRAGDVADVLAALMRDCRVADVRVHAGVHPDRDPATGMTLLFRADVVADPKRSAVH